MRTECIWCGSIELTDIFSEDRQIPVASYTTETSEDGVWIPLNIQRCGKCFAHQVKTLGDPALVYGKNHAYSYGSTLRDMCTEFTEFIGEQGSDILELGAGNGFLADMLLTRRPDCNYTIVDPSYFGSTENRTIVPYFFEDYIPTGTPDTLVMSHVFEHIYSPRKVLESIPLSVETVFLNFPDLEKYVQNDTFHVLNPEHTFFVENQFLVKTFRRYGFECVRQSSFRDHSVFFHFRRTSPSEPDNYINPNADELIRNYYTSIQTKVNLIQSTPGQVYLWPCSMHTQYVLSFGVDRTKIAAVLDNCSAKHGTYLYGYGIECRPFDPKLNPILLGGCFTREVTSSQSMSLEHIATQTLPSEDGE